MLEILTYMGLAICLILIAFLTLAVIGDLATGRIPDAAGAALSLVVIILLALAITKLTGVQI